MLRKFLYIAATQKSFKENVTHTIGSNLWWKLTVKWTLSYAPDNLRTAYQSSEAAAFIILFLERLIQWWNKYADVNENKLEAMMSILATAVRVTLIR
jgi:hypothetical protein